MKRALLRGASAATMVIVGGLWASQALAQAAAPPPAAPPAAAPAPEGGAVIVTATRRNVAIEHVPVAVSAFTAKQRDLLGIQTTQQLSDFTPGLSYFASNDRAYIRGIGRNTVSLATESGVATYYNGVYYGANATIAEQHDSLFVSQIEVDRGPQNTLHGSNADGGTINYISARPTHDFYAEGRIGAQSYGEYSAEAVVSGPITDWLRFRVGGNYTDESGGYFHNLADDSHVGGNLAQGNNGHQEYFEAQLDANLGPNLDAWAMFSAGDYRTSFHTASTVGDITNYQIPNASLSPSGFYGLCALPGQAANIGCALTGPGSTGQVVIPGSVVTGRVNASQFPGNNPSNSNLRNFIQNYTDVNRQDRDIALATNITYHFPSADLKYTGGYQSFYYDLGAGGGADSGVLSYQVAGLSPAAAALNCAGFEAVCEAPLTLNTAGAHLTFVEDEQYFSNELSLSSTAPGPLQWIAGAYWYHEHYNQPVNALCRPFQEQIAAPLSLAGAAAAPNPSGCLFQEDAVITYDSLAGYGQVTWQIDPVWKVEAAARYTNDHKAGYEQHRVIGFDDTLLGLPFLGAATPAIDITPLAVLGATGPYPGTAGAHYNATTGQEVRNVAGSWDAVTGEVTLNWQPDASTLAYAKYSRGYKTGGFQVGTIAPSPETAPEYVDSFEGGLKKTIGGRFQLNAAVFYYNYQNDQQPLTIQNATTGTLTGVIFNIPSVHTYGVELEGIWRPIDNLTLTGQYSYLSAKVASMDGRCVENTLDPLAVLPGSNRGSCAPTIGTTGGVPSSFVQPVNLVGSTLPESPANKISLNGLYTWKFEPGNLSLSASYIWKDKTYGAIFNNPQNTAPSYSTVNLRLQWDDAQNRYNISGFVDNVFNTTGYDIVTGTQLAPGSNALPLTSRTAYNIVTSKSLTFPLTFGAELQFRFR